MSHLPAIALMQTPFLRAQLRQFLWLTKVTSRVERCEAADLPHEIGGFAPLPRAQVLIADICMDQATAWGLGPGVDAYLPTGLADVGLDRVGRQLQVVRNSWLVMPWAMRLSTRLSRRWRLPPADFVVVRPRCC